MTVWTVEDLDVLSLAADCLTSENGEHRGSVREPW